MGLFRVKARRFLGPNVYPEAPDGGWGWVVAVAFFFVEAFSYGIIKSFGIFLEDLMNEFQETNSRISWIVSICVFVMTFNGPLSSMMTNRLGFQVVVVIGGILITVGTIATSFANSVNQMYITYGLIAGMGYSLTFLPTVSLLSQYFSRRRSLVTAVASTGESLAIFALAPAFSALKDHIGWRHTMAVIGTLQSTVIICGVLLRPIVIKPKEIHMNGNASSKEAEALTTQETDDIQRTDDSRTQPNTSSSPDKKSSTGDLKDTANGYPEGKSLLNKDTGSEAEQKEVESQLANKCEKKDKDAEKQEVQDEEAQKSAEKIVAKNCKLLDFSVLREPSFIFYSLFGLFATLGFFAPQLYVIELSASRGVERATYMLSTMAVAEIVGRFTIGWVLTWKQLADKKLFVLLACIIALTVDLVGFTLATEVCGLAVCCAVYGFFMGTVACTHIPMLAEDDVVGIERMSPAAGVYVFIQSFAGLAGPPLGGVIVDVTKNYGSAFYSFAAGMALSAIFLGLVKPAKRWLLCNKTNSEHPEDPDQHEMNKDCGEQSPVLEPHKGTDNIQDSLKVNGDLDHNQMGATSDVQDVIRFA
ncbi:monocarboxylate transporter 7 [Betta splendens]|uniref:Monocarboxylate transporter 7 n=1 Tax=Betta splendens TaxID=158456 RepID=A0A6P7LCL1_BETSP|nr:monocarboxylate transporter 7 [Betta splendens]